VIVTDATQFSRGFWVPCLLTEFLWSYAWFRELWHGI